MQEGAGVGHPPTRKGVGVDPPPTIQPWLGHLPGKTLPPLPGLFMGSVERGVFQLPAPENLSFHQKTFGTRKPELVGHVGVGCLGVPAKQAATPPLPPSVGWGLTRLQFQPGSGEAWCGARSWRRGNGGGGRDNSSCRPGSAAA